MTFQERVKLRDSRKKPGKDGGTGISSEDRKRTTILGRGDPENSNPPPANHKYLRQSE